MFLRGIHSHFCDLILSMVWMQFSIKMLMLKPVTLVAIAKRKVNGYDGKSAALTIFYTKEHECLVFKLGVEHKSRKSHE